MSDDLARFGAALGAMRWVQGCGGNVSIKHDGLLYLKSAGARLRDVGAAHTVVPLALAERAVAGDADADAQLFAIKPRPALDVYCHALGARAVATASALGVMLLACARAPLLDGSVTRAQYRRPGRGVALGLRDAVRDRPISGVIVIESSGVVAYADSPEEAVSMIVDLDERARAEIGTSLPDVEEFLVANLAEGEEIDVPGGRARPLRRRRVSGRYLFPDAVVFAEHIRVSTVDLPTAARALKECTRPSILFDGLGERWVVARSSELLGYAVEVTSAHDWLEDALVARALARYLADEEAARIVQLPPEAFGL